MRLTLMLRACLPVGMVPGLVTGAPRAASRAAGRLPSTGPAVGATSLPARAKEGPNDFFEELRRRPETKFAYSLRSEEEVAKYRRGRNTTYDPRMDAARFTLPENRPNASQVWLPIHMRERGQTVIIWEWRASPNYVRENGIRGHKMFQVRRDDGKHGRIWLEPGSAYLRAPKGTRLSRVRLYGSPGPKTIRRKGGFDFTDEYGRVHYNSDSLGPVYSNFELPRDTWGRFMLVIEQRAGDKFAHVWYHATHERKDPVTILKDAQVSIGSPPGKPGEGRPMHFDFEINSSQPRKGPEVWSWGRNVLVLRGVKEPEKLLRRPVRGDKGPAAATRPAPRAAKKGP